MAMRIKRLVGVLVSLQIVRTCQFAPFTAVPAAGPTFNAVSLAATSDKRAAIAAMLADFSSDRVAKLAETSLRHDGLLRAVGTPKDGDNNDDLGMLVDATAGSGGDAAYLAWHGWNVTMLEREAATHKALAAALSANDVPTPIAERLCLYQKPCDAREVLQLLHPEVVYLDPMSPSSSSSNRNGPGGAGQGAPDKRTASSPTLDLNEQRQILAAALSAASQRVVVKRPIHAPPLGDIQPCRFAASNMLRQRCRVRYDIYSADVPRDSLEIVSGGLAQEDVSDELDAEKSKEMRMMSMMRRMRMMRIKRMRFPELRDEDGEKPHTKKRTTPRKASARKVGKKESEVTSSSDAKESLAADLSGIGSEHVEALDVAGSGNARVNAKVGKRKNKSTSSGKAKESLAAEAASTGNVGANAKLADDNAESTAKANRRKPTDAKANNRKPTDAKLADENAERIAKAGSASSSDARENSAAHLPGVGPKRLEALDAAGLGRVGALAEIADQEVESIAKANKLPPKSLRKWVEAARELVVNNR